MGAVCTGAKGKTPSAATAGAEEAASEQPGATSPGADAHTAKTSELNHGAAAAAPPAAGAAANGVASAGEQPGPHHEAGGGMAELETFTLGEGSGVYLVEEKGQGGILVTQYARESPPADVGLVLLQVKPPPYKPIPESRYTLQGGKRILRQNIAAFTKNTAGKAKYCGLILDFVGLADTYKGFLWASTHLDEAQQPFCVFVMETKRRLSTITALQRGASAAASGADAAAPAEQQKPGEGAEAGGPAAEKTEKQAQDQPNAGGADNAESGEPASNDGGEQASDALYVHYLEGGGAISYRMVARCAVLPLPLEKAKEIIPEGTKVESVEELQKQVVKAGGAFKFDSPASGS